ncbi:MAG: cysteine desulfurase family protein [Nanobdellota archaeon]
MVQEFFKSIYVDNGATTRVRKDVVEVMQKYFEKQFGNPSSKHAIGEKARTAVEKSRQAISKVFNAKPEEIIFTSGGSESNNLAIKGTAFSQDKGKKDHIITTTIEHKSVLKTCQWLETQGFKVTYLKPDSKGFIDPNAIKKTITKRTFLVSIIHGNNEIGTVQDVKSIANICEENNVLFHIDACQSFLKTPLDTPTMPVDLISINAHKLHGPKGVGALYIRNGTTITPLIHGGNQEKGLRAGTENVPGIVGFSKAVQLSRSEKELQELKTRQEKLIEGLLSIENSHLNGPKGEFRLAHNINIRFDDVDSDTLSGYLDRKGIITSTSSACSARSTKPSQILKEIGLTSNQAKESLRLGISYETTQEDVEYIVKTIQKTVKKIRKKSFVERIFDK